MRLYTSIHLFFLASVITSHSEPIYYAIHEGENYERVSWHSSPTKGEFEKVLQKIEVFDSYTVKLEGEQIRDVHRNYTTPSGDWIFEIHYLYGKNGFLTKISYDFRTFTGYDEALDEVFPTRCVRAFSRDEAGNFVQVAEKITDVVSGKTVKRGFHTPEVVHWTTVAGLPQVVAKQADCEGGDGVEPK